MPRYFFNIFDAVEIQDEIGTELSNIEAAGVEAVQAAGQMIKDAYKRITVGQDWWMEVTDERGLLLFRLNFLFIGAPATLIARPIIKP